MIEPLAPFRVGRPRGSQNLSPEERAERVRERAARFRARYPLRSKASDAAQHANDRAASLGIAGRLTRHDVLDVWDRNPLCVSCGEGRGIDHIVAMRDGGPNTPGNLQNLCHDCNVRKGYNREPMPECRRGHSLTGDNLYPNGDGRRRCRRCELDRQEARRRLRGVPSGYRRPDSCRAGHPRTPENTYTRPDGRYQCATCIRAAISYRRGKAG